MPEGARHDVDLCPFCVEKAAQKVEVPTSGPSGSEPSGVVNQNPTTEGGNTDMSNTPETISMETHEALLEKALKDATSTTEDALGRKTEEAAGLTSRVTELETANSTLSTDNERLNKELDEAQVQLKAAKDELDAIKAEQAKATEDAKKAEIASARAEQVKNLSLFDEKYVADKASKWAELAEEEWTERLEEWRGIKPASEGSSIDSASAMTGTSEELTKEPAADTANHNDKPAARRAVLGLTS